MESLFLFPTRYPLVSWWRDEVKRNFIDWLIDWSTDWLVRTGEKMRIWNRHSLLIKQLQEQDQAPFPTVKTSWTCILYRKVEGRGIRYSFTICLPYGPCSLVSRFSSQAQQIINHYSYFPLFLNCAPYFSWLFNGKAW